MNFDYVKNAYHVPAEMHREVMLKGKKGVIMEDMGNYIGVVFYDSENKHPQPCHPIWEMEYLDTFNYNPPIEKITASKRRYKEFLDADSGLNFREWLGIKPKNKNP